MNEAKTYPNAEYQRRHRVGLLTRVKRVEAMIENLSADVRAVLASKSANPSPETKGSKNV